MGNLIKSFFKKIKEYNSRKLLRISERNSILIAQLHINRIKTLGKVDNLEEVEFKVFSEWGEDGIIQYLINNVDIKNKTFIEFGVEDYKESNTRFLLINNLWKGLVIDSDKNCINSIKKDEIYWRYDLNAVNAFITGENINNIITDNGFRGETGILSIDIDGNDYWVWEKIDSVDPAIVICEYNSLLGYTHPVSVPYDPDFFRTAAHFSNLYFGASLPALVKLAEKKGYDFAGSNSAGSNAFFVKRELSGNLKKYSIKDGYREIAARQSRNEKGELTFLNREESWNILKDLEVVNTETGQTIKLKEIFDSDKI